ncbi:diguanylate cyclase [Leclercia sp. 119287]|nr:diguanylate cyclase [Leclercia sp. 119287]
MLFFNKDFWSLLKRNRVLVIFDEVHHCSGSSLENANSWGEEIILNIQNHAAFTLALTGTPWRSDKTPIVMARYSDPEGRIQCDFAYGLKEATRDHVCRVPNIVLVDNEHLVLSEDDEDKKIFKSLQDLLSHSDITYHAVITNDSAMKHVLSLAISRLESIREDNPDAGGLIVASSVQHALLILHILKGIFNQSAVLVSYKDPKAVKTIEDFRANSIKWIVSVGMVSEGTDIPRLQVCCHLSRVKTELYFRQVLGRILRINKASNQEAWLYTFAEPQLTEFAHRLKEDVPECIVVFDAMDKHPTQTNTGITLEGLGLTSSPIRDFQKLIFSRNIPITDKVTLSSPSLSEHTHTEVLQFLGRFRERMVNVFDSPFQN